ncbi:MAG: tetratricopeptide repeat protein [Proteobacteria bacterium]|nr:tetratricopeptide repeat protein [Pseudomonadota bacterium]
MALTDIRGLELTTESVEAVEHFNRSIAANAEYRLTAVDHMARAREADPDFTMAHCAMGYYMMTAEALVPDGMARQCLDDAEATDLARITPRERASVEALRAWVEGRQEDAVQLWERILNAHPTDLLTLMMIHYRNFWHGKAMAIRDSVARCIRAWDVSMPNYSNILGMYSFGLNENGDRARALELGMRAIELNPNDLWSVHAVAHVLYDTGEHRKGLAFLGEFEEGAWDDRNAIREHLWWHESLFDWELGNFDRVLRFYDDRFAKSPTSFYLDIQNTASILFRMECCGVDVGDRWSELTSIAAERAVARNLAFTDVHVAMVLGRTGQKDEMSSLLDSVRSDSERARNALEMSVAETDIAVCEAIDAYYREDYETAIERLLPVRWNGYRSLGASDAQRDVLGVLLGHAGLKSGDAAFARAVFAQRIEEKPRSQMSWLWYASALEQCGDATGAAQARKRAKLIADASVA